VEGDEDEDILNFQRDMMENLEGDDDDYDDDSDLDEDYLQKLDTSLQKDIVRDFHPELLQHKNEEIEALSKVVKNDLDVIVDPFHKTVPFLTKFEKARILGERAKQLNAGGKPFVNVDASVIDGYLIAEKELEEKKIPFIIKRPLTNGGCEYWKIEDLEVLY
jgi:DNA-directed RNA polymerase I, II, and III subunit RPABC2